MGDLTDSWLKANDPDYGDRSKTDYLTRNRLRKVARKEIPATYAKTEVLQLFDLPVSLYTDDKVRRLFGR